MSKPNLNKIIKDNLDKAKFQSKSIPSLPTNSWIDAYSNGGIYLSDRAKATQFGQYKRGGGYFPEYHSWAPPRMDWGGDPSIPNLQSSVSMYNEGGPGDSYEEMQKRNAKESIDFLKDWYTKRATLPQFKDVSERRLNVLDKPMDIDYVDPAKMYKQGIAGFYNPFTKRFQIADPNSESANLPEYKNYMQANSGSPLFTHELGHRLQFEAPQFTDVVPSKIAKKFKDYRDLTQPAYIDVTTGKRKFNKKNAVTLYPEMESYLAMLRQAEGIDPTKPLTADDVNGYLEKYDKYKDADLKSLPPEKVQEYHRGMFIKKFFDSLGNDPQVIADYHNSVAMNKQKNLDMAKYGGWLNKYQTAGQVGDPNQPYHPILNPIGYHPKISDILAIQQKHLQEAADSRPQIKQGHKELPYEKRAREERARQQAQENSELAQTMALFTPSGSNTAAGAIGASTMANTLPYVGVIPATARMANAITHPMNNQYWSPDNSLWQNGLGVLGATGDIFNLKMSGSKPVGQQYTLPYGRTIPRTEMPLGFVGESEKVLPVGETPPEMSYHSPLQMSDEELEAAAEELGKKAQEANIDPTGLTIDDKNIHITPEEYREILKKLKLHLSLADVLNREGLPKVNDIWDAPTNKLTWRDPKTGEIRYELESDDYNNFRTPNDYKEALSDFHKYKRDYWQRLINQRNRAVQQAKIIGQYGSKGFPKESPDILNSKNLLRNFPGFDIPDFIENLGAEYPMYHKDLLGNAHNISGIDPASLVPYKIGLKGMGQLPPNKMGGMITDPRGQWAHPGKNTRIPGNNITMQGVPYPVLAKANNGMSTMMYPGQNYSFPGASHVDEYPMMQKGGATSADSLLLYNNQLLKDAFYKNDPSYRSYKSLTSNKHLQNLTDAISKGWASGIVDVSFLNKAFGTNIRENELRNRFRKLPNSTNVYSSGDVLNGFVDTYFNPSAPPSYFSDIIKPKKWINYGSDKYGDSSDVPMYDALEIKPYNLRTPKEKIEWENKYGKPKPKPKPELTLKKKVLDVQPINIGHSFYPGVTSIQHPDITIPNVPQGKYRTSYWDPEIKDWNEIAFMSQEASDKFAQEMSQRGYPGAYGNITQRVQYANGGWLDKYQVAGQVSDPTSSLKNFIVNWNNSPMAQSMLKDSVDKDDPIGFNSSYVNNITNKRNILANNAKLNFSNNNSTYAKDPSSEESLKSAILTGGISDQNVNVDYWRPVLGKVFTNPSVLINQFNTKDKMYNDSAIINPKYYTSQINLRTINPNTKENLDKNWINETAIHELSHASDYGGYFMPKSDKDKIWNYAYHDPYKIGPSGATFRKLNDWGNYVSNPTETRARLMNFRYNAKNQGLYDPFTQKITLDKLQQYKPANYKDKYSQGFDPLDQLRSIYTDKQIVDLLNSVSKNEGSQMPATTARYGGGLNKYQTAGQVAADTDEQGLWGAGSQLIRNMYNNPIINYITGTPTVKDAAINLVDPTGASNAPFLWESIGKMYENPSIRHAIGLGLDILGSIPVFGEPAKVASKTLKQGTLSKKVGRTAAKGVKKMINTVEYPAKLVNTGYRKIGINSPFLNNPINMWNRGIHGYQTGLELIRQGLNAASPGTDQSVPQQKYGGWLSKYAEGGPEGPSTILDKYEDPSMLYGEAPVTTNTYQAPPLELTPPAFNKYQIQKGDTLTGISRRTNVPLTTLAQVNALQNPNKIIVGKQLNIPTKFDRELSFQEIPTSDNKKIVIDNFSKHYDYILEGDKLYYKVKGGKTWSDISNNQQAKQNIANFIDRNNYWAGYGSGEREMYTNNNQVNKAAPKPVVQSNPIQNTSTPSFSGPKLTDFVYGKNLPFTQSNDMGPYIGRYNYINNYLNSAKKPTTKPVSKKDLSIGDKTLNFIEDMWDTGVNAGKKAVNFTEDMWETGVNGIKRKLAFKTGESDDVETKPQTTGVSDKPLGVQEYYKKYGSPNTSTSYDVQDDPNGRQYKSEKLDLSTLKFKARNRDDEREFQSEGMPVTIQFPFVSPKELPSVVLKESNKKQKVEDNSSVIGVDNQGNFVNGQYKDFKNRTDVVISKSPMNRVVSFDEYPNGISRTKPDTEHHNKNFQVPIINVLSEKDNKSIQKGSLNILTKPGKENFYGSVQGGRFVIQNPDTKKSYLVSGSLAEIKQKFKEIKGNSQYANIYVLDNGTYSRGLSFKDKKFTSNRLHSYDNENTGGGNGLYITSTQLPVNKYKEEYIQTPNVRTEADESYKKGHKLKNEVKNVILHHTAYYNPATNEQEVNKQYMTKGANTSHVVIQENGKRTIYGSPEQVTFHAGESRLNGRDNVNDFSIGVEFQGSTSPVYDDKTGKMVYKGAPLTQAQIESFVEYYKPIAEKYHISLKDIVTHQMIRDEYLSAHPESRKEGVKTKPDITQKEYKRVLKYMQDQGLK
jgi:N-acetyl-anhydromuramyl-L-alanine amidase AmpD/LysM repeat protein